MVGIIFIGDLKYCPYLSKYVNILEENSTKYEVLYWNREGSLSIYPYNYISFNVKSKLNMHPILKLYDFINFRAWLIKQINLKRYDKLIILSTLSGVIISDLLFKKYPKKYIFDIRDYSYEHNKLFSMIEKKLIKLSYFTCLSSEGFKNFLPKGFSYVNVHNFNKKNAEYKGKFIKKVEGQTLNLVWIGAVRYFAYQKKIINKLKNDSRFEMIYHGSGADLEEFKKYCDKNEVKNIIFTGEYNNEQKSELIAGADIINNSYMTAKIMEVQYAISNKYYDGIIHRIPQLVEQNTYKHTKVVENGLGVAIDPDDYNFADKLYDYYHSINEVQFNNDCFKELNKTIEDDEYYLEAIGRFIGTNI